MKYVLLPLLATGAPCMINIDTIATAYEDTNRDKQRGLKIYTTDGDYTFVDCKLHELLQELNRIESYEDPEDIDDDIPDPPYYDCDGRCCNCNAEGCKYRTELFFDDDFDEGGPDDDLASIDKGTGMIVGGGPDE